MTAALEKSRPASRRDPADQGPPSSNRARLVAHARRLFAERGFADVSVDEIAAAASLTKGAVYYQFRDKTDLFRAACESVLKDIALEVNLAGRALNSPKLEELATGAPRMFDAYGSQEARRLLLIEGPAVLGFDKWMDLLNPMSPCMIRTGLDHWVNAGLIPADQAETLSHLLFGAFIQGALRVAGAADPAAADAEVRQAAETLVRGFMAGREVLARA